MKLFRIALGFIASFSACTAFALQPTTEFSNVTISPFKDKAIMVPANAGMATPIETLDVLGVGLSVEMFRQAHAWVEMQKHPGRSILPENLSAFESNYTMKDLISEKRSADVLERGASRFVEQWAIPSISIWAHCDKKETTKTYFGGKTSFGFFNDRVNDLRMPAGMHHHQIVSLGSIFLDDPEDVLERAFQFFEQNPEVPALLLYASDGDMIRQYTGEVSRRPYWEEGPRRVGSMTESMVALVLARRDRVDAIRPFVANAMGDRNAQYFAERDRLLNAARAAARAAGKPEPTKLEFKPSRFVPKPWTAEQLSQFDRLPTIAVLHRPVRVTYRKDKHGKPTFDPAQKASLMHEQEQQAAFKVGLDAALRDVPGGIPARVFYDTAGPTTGRHVVPFTVAAYHSLPGFDLFKPEQGYDISARIGNTGAASPFVQWALSAIAGYQKNDTSMTLNLRQNDEATITVVTPSPPSGVRKNFFVFDFNPTR
ncbi:DUF2875 family protein [Massilia sp. R2A-15]|uniref:type VI lipase adapter Tla3 domain-containing protein n=1 Tax=Massilia sp. R2A-15 TaxID=3064278 RepID=UPI0027348A9E|nr:DUF2875 family protein [Massilia sp. R2A-15]WLI90453.1 DUF2875 family protein [Massilia sp. R2A-15]